MKLTMLIIYTVGFFLYFLPTIIGWNKRNSNSILALNLFLGWTFIGWVIALVWALSKDSINTIILPSKKRKKKMNKKDRKYKVKLREENSLKPNEKVWSYQNKKTK